jgi:hypothetical protein
VELYVNNVLVDYVKADASGFFTFEVPLVYGNTMVRLRFYGPWGEERTKEQSLTRPYNFIPKRELEYPVSAGVVEDSVWSRYSRADLNYGATRFLTLGGGAEYLSSVTATPVMPFVNASLRLPGNVLLSGEYTHAYVPGEDCHTAFRPTYRWILTISGMTGTRRPSATTTWKSGGLHCPYH